jgi:Zn-dependent M32 family carboxypeptidase
VRWLGERIYREGGRLPSARLIEAVTGAPPDHRPLVAALRERYAALYDL